MQCISGTPLGDPLIWTACLVTPGIRLRNFNARKRTKPEINLFWIPSQCVTTLWEGGGIPQQGFPIPGVICSNTLEPLSTNLINEEFSLKSRDGWRRRRQ